MTEKTVFITGISSGIGLNICTSLLDNDYEVVGTYNSGQDMAKKLQKKYGKRLSIHQVNLAERKQTIQLVEKIANIEFHSIVNNAGMIDFEDFTDFDYGIWDHTIEVNLTAPLIFSQRLKLGKGGAVINIASTDGMTGSFSSLSYAVSKAGLINLTKSLGNNLGLRGIRSVAVAPGWIDTGMSTEESYEATKLTPLGRNGNPQEIADLVLFLISEKASFINGSTIVVDGGYTNVDYIMMQEAKGNS